MALGSQVEPTNYSENNEKEVQNSKEDNETCVSKKGK